MTQLPEFVYFVTVDSEWPVSAVADGPYVAETVEREVQRRSKGMNGPRPHLVHVWKARVTDVEEVEFVPARVTPAELKSR